MKKITIALVAGCALLISTGAYAHIFIGKKGGGPHGYKVVDETHEAGTHTLDCHDPGYESCTWTTKPLVATTVGQYDVDNLVSQVEANLANQVYQGNFLLDQELIVSWSGQSINYYDMSIVPVN